MDQSWNEKRISDFIGIYNSTVNPPENSLVECKNLDLREKSGELTSRKGYRLKYPAPVHSRLSNPVNLGFENFYVSENGGREITVCVQKATLIADAGDNVDILAFFIRPYYDGSSWIDAWQWVNEMHKTRVFLAYPNFGISGVTLTSAYYGWIFLNISKTTYEVGTYTDKALQFTSNWSAGEDIIFMKNYFPYDYLKAMSSATKDDIVFLKILEDIKIAFGGYQNRLAVSIGYRKQDFNFKTGETESFKINGFIADPYNAVTGLSNLFSFSAENVNGGSVLGSGTWQFVYTLVLDDFEEFPVYRSSPHITGDTTDWINIQIGVKLGVISRRATKINLYASRSGSPFYFIYSFSLKELSTYHKFQFDIYGFFLNDPLFSFDNSNWNDRGGELDDVLGYVSGANLTTADFEKDLVKSFDDAVLIQGYVYAINPYRDKRYSNVVAISEVSGDGEFQYDVLKGTYLNNKDFSGNDAKSIIRLANDDLGIHKATNYNQIEKTAGVQSGIGFINKGTSNRRSVIKRDNDFIWGSEFDIYQSYGYRVYDLSKDTIRIDYRDNINKSNIFAILEKNDNAYRFSDGTKEYLFSSRGWQEINQHIKPIRYVLGRDNNVWFMDSSGNIYFESGYYDVDATDQQKYIPFLLKTIEFSIRKSDALKSTQLFIIGGVFVEFKSTIPADTVIKIYTDDTLLKSIAVESNDFIPIKSHTCRKIQLEVSGSTNEKIRIESIGFLWKKTEGPRQNAK